MAARRVAIGGLCVSAGLGLWLWYSHRRDSQAQQPDAATDPATRHGGTYQAAFSGHEGGVRALVEAGASVDRANSRDQTPLHAAPRMGHEAVMRVLVTTGNDAVDAATDPATRHGGLYQAAFAGHEGSVRAFVEAGASVDQADSRGHTPLHAAARMGHEAVVRFLVTTGNAAVDLADNDGITPLVAAAFAGQLAVSQLLAAHGAAVAVVGRGFTSEDLARARGHHGVAAFLGAVAGWPGFKIAAACRLADAARSSLRHGRLDPAGSCTLAELASVTGSPAGALWLGSPAACDATAALSKDAMAHWAPSVHILFHAGIRGSVLVMFQVRERLGRQQPPGAAALPELPDLTWRLVCSFFLRRNWPVPR